MVDIKDLEVLIPGDYYYNKTRSYLFPCVKLYGNPLMKNLAYLQNLSYVGLDDEGIDYVVQEPAIFLFFQIPKEIKIPFITVVDTIRKQPAYLYDYSVGEMFSGRLHCFVLKIPKMCLPAYYNFISGKYSQMYKIDEIKYLFGYSKELLNKSNQAFYEIKKYQDKARASEVVQKNKLAKLNFEQQFNKDHYATIKLPENAEIDFLPRKEEEIFRYQGLNRLKNLKKFYEYEY